MFCDTCHWYTAGKKTCPHCGAPQDPKKAKDMFNLPGDVSVLDDSFMDKPLTDAPMPAIAVSPPPPAPKPPSPSVPGPSAPQAVYCGRCGARVNTSRFCSRCGAALTPK